MPLTPPAFISLRTRFMAMAVLLTLATSAVWGLWVWDRERQFLHERLSGESRMLARTMSIPIISAILYEELGIIAEGGLLDNFMADIMSNHQLHPLYALVIDNEGRVLAHDRLVDFGRVLDDHYSRQALASATILETPILVDGKQALEIAAPLAIGGKKWGALRVGVSLEPLRRDLRVLGMQIALFALTFSIGALIVFAYVGQRLASPLTALARRMEEADHHTGPCDGCNFRGDEIGLLQKSFCQMIDRLRRSEEERQQSVARMLENERIATVGKIVSGVAHEVNNPLAGIQGALYQIEQKSDPPVHRYVRLVEQSVERIGRIVGQLLDLSRSGAMEMESVNSGDFFQELLLFSKMAVKERECRLEAQDNCPSSTIRLDKDKIHQVILNLVLNGADAGGAQGRVELLAYQSRHWYCLSVRDDGLGIPPEIAERIFEPFFTTKEPGKGSGMGLAISRSIAEAHGGSLELLPSGGKGTLFELKIPMERPLG